MSMSFMPWSALGGGILIGMASLLLLVALGGIAGISGIAAGLPPPRRGGIGWRLAFVIGLPMGAALWMLGVGGASERIGVLWHTRRSSTAVMSAS